LCLTANLTKFAIEIKKEAH